MTLSPRLSNGLQSADTPSMKTDQTASNRLHPPAHAGTATGGVGSGLFDEMTAPPTPGTLEWYRERGKTNPDIAALVVMIDRQSSVIANALQALADERRKSKQDAA